MLERDERKLLKKIEDAHAAIQQRIEELKLGTTNGALGKGRPSPTRCIVFEPFKGSHPDHPLKPAARVASYSGMDRHHETYVPTVSHAITT